MPQKSLGIVIAVGALSMALAPSANAQKSDSGNVWASRFGGNVKVLLGVTPLTTSNPNRMPYRDARDNAICVAPESLASLGITARVEGSIIKLTGADKNLVVVTARQGPFERAGGIFVDAVEVLKTMGIAALSFDQGANTLVLRSILNDVSLQGDTLRVSAGLPVTPKITTESDGLRVIVDFPGATVGELPRQLTLSSAKVLAVRTQQLDENTARLILDLAEPLAISWKEGRAARVATLGPQGVSAPAPLASPTIIAESTPSVSAGKSSLPASMILRELSTSSLSDDRLRFTLAANRLPAVRPSLVNGRLTLDFGNIYLADSAKTAAGALSELKHPLIKSAQLVPVGSNAARLLVELASTVGYTIRHSKGGGLLVDLLTPRKTEGPLVGKTIVVDPGHGGSSSPGNRGHDGVYERSLTLPMALSLAQALEDMGANVILTRESDFDPGLYERANIANRAFADLFVSVHCNDGSSNHTIRGTEVYYHSSEPMSRDLAKFIADKVRTGVDGIPVRGALSDYRIYPGEGFAVLRNSQMAGVLVEAGYMSNGADYSALKNKSTQLQMGIAIAQGIADFFGANPNAMAARFVKPQTQRDYGFPPPLALPDNDSTELPVK